MWASRPPVPDTHPRSGEGAKAGQVRRDVGTRPLASTRRATKRPCASETASDDASGEEIRTPGDRRTGRVLHEADDVGGRSVRRRQERGGDDPQPRRSERHGAAWKTAVDGPRSACSFFETFSDLPHHAQHVQPEDLLDVRVAVAATAAAPPSGSGTSTRRRGPGRPV